MTNFHESLGAYFYNQLENQISGAFCMLVRNINEGYNG